jgi:hypothetical protein
MLWFLNLFTHLLLKTLSKLPNFSNLTNMNYICSLS